MIPRHKEDAATLEILESIERQSDLTQRHLATRLGVALGLANSYLRRCVRKGLVKVTQAPANRYLYYLTPKGFAEKSRLTARYLSLSFDFYRRASDSCRAVFELCVQRSFDNVVLYGHSELAEIATLRADEGGVTVLGLMDPEASLRAFVGRPAWSRWEDVPEFAACVLTALDDPARHCEALLSRLDSKRVLVPSILGIADTGEIHRPPLPGSARR